MVGERGERRRSGLISHARARAPFAARRDYGYAGRLLVEVDSVAWNPSKALKYRRWSTALRGTGVSALHGAEVGAKALTPADS
ncbi:hypothetical protein BN2476_380102 [Paraburkholderia piptadeniae]|uniref:Uncharacterized protein n=1 Tax=Paraburkholderia piptadeniae TaxID=1701573 RepID=A0A1N7SA14_9BURK|nr:hypothetical protein BN2476_380102 [Paraburkholderia piptadeniae]